MATQMSPLVIGVVLMGFLLLWVTLLAWSSRDSANAPGRRSSRRHPNAHVWWANEEWDEDWRREWQRAFGRRG